MTDGAKAKGKGMKGALNRFLAGNLETILAIPGSKMYKKFAKAACNVAASQEAVLKDVLNFGKDTVFGRERGFGSIRTAKDFQTKIPVHDYEALRPYVDRHKKGEENVLFPGKPLMYNRSSGTTTLPKLIPITKYNFERTIKNRSKLWLYGLQRSFPGIYKGKSFSVVSPAVEGYTEDGTPYGSLSGVMRQNIPEFMKLTHAAPWCTTLIKDFDSKIYTMLRFALAADVTVIITGNPATVLNLAVKADLWKEDLIRDIRDGALKAQLILEPEIRSEVEAMLEADPARAGFLDRIASSGDSLRPSEYWPNLGLVHTWKNGNTRLVIPKLKPWFGANTPILDFGYIASEIMATDLVDPRTDGSILQIKSGFYEFSKVEDGYDSGREFLLAHQLELGRRYYIYVTNLSGLYRYDMNDVLEVIGRFNEAPIVRFLYKGKGITNLQGEKLSEEQFIEALSRASKKSEICHDFFIGYADSEASGYKLYIELFGAHSAIRLENFARAVDEALCEVNVEYEAKLRSQRLKPIAVIRMGKDFFPRYRSLRLKEGAHDGQIKWLHLSATDADKNRLESLMKQEGSTLVR